MGDTLNSNTSILEIRSNSFPFSLGIIVIAEIKLQFNVGGKVIDTVTISDSTGNLLWKIAPKMKSWGGARTIRYVESGEQLFYSQIYPPNNSSITPLTKGALYGITIHFKDNSFVKDRFVFQRSTIYLKINSIEHAA
jgi:hypothetical protein